MAKEILTQEQLKDYLSYNPETGIFVRRVTVCGNAKAGTTAGCFNARGYCTIGINNKRYKAHRLAWLYQYGVLPAGEIDHINHNKSDNRIANLRTVTHRENGLNQPIRHDNSSGHTGVYFNNRTGKWCAQISKIKGRDYLGSFAHKEQAITARKYAEIKHGFHVNHGKEQ